MSMPNRRRTVIARSLGELAVIVVGVLIALWVNSWAEERSELEAQDYLLASLTEEVATNVLALDSTVTKENDILTAMRILNRCPHRERGVSNE